MQQSSEGSWTSGGEMLHCDNKINNEEARLPQEQLKIYNYDTQNDFSRDNYQKNLSLISALLSIRKDNPTLLTLQ